MRRVRSLALASALVLLTSLSACERGSQPPPEPPETTAAPATTTFTMGDTFGALRAIHSAEVEHGTLAQRKASDPRVKSFAQRVVSDHEARMKKDNRLMSGLGVTAKDSAVSERIKNAADRRTARLEGLSGGAFDRAYVEEQVDYYRAALDVFDKDLLPHAKDPQIKAGLTEARAKASAHLREAEDLRMALIDKP